VVFVMLSQLLLHFQRPVCLIPFVTVVTSAVLKTASRLPSCSLMQSVPMVATAAAADLLSVS
jgi:hypothetical protein